MARNATRKAEAADNTVAVTLSVMTTEPELHLPFAADSDPGRMVPVAELPPASIAYLLQYGLNKTCQDAASGAIARIKEAVERRDANNYGTDDSGKKAAAADAKAIADARKAIEAEGEIVSIEPEAFARAYATALQAKRWRDVLAGEMDVPVPGRRQRRSAFDRIVHDLALAFIRTEADRQKRDMPKGADLERVLDKVLASAKGAEFRKVAETTLGNQAEESADIFA